MMNQVVGRGKVDSVEDATISRSRQLDYQIRFRLLTPVKRG